MQPKSPCGLVRVGSELAADSSLVQVQKGFYAKLFPGFFSWPKQTIGQVGLRLLFSLLHLGSYTSLTSKAPKIEVSDNFIFYFIFNKSKFHLLDLKFFSHWCGLLVIFFFFCELVFSIRLSHLRKRDVIL